MSGGTPSFHNWRTTRLKHNLSPHESQINSPAHHHYCELIVNVIIPELSSRRYQRLFGLQAYIGKCKQGTFHSLLS